MVKIKKRYSQLILSMLGVFLLFDLISHLTAEILWFREVGYLQVFWLRLNTKVWLWTIAFSSTTAFLLANLTIAKRLKYGERGKEKGNKKNRLTSKNIAASGGLKLSFLLPVVLILSVLAGLILIYFGQEAVKWYPIKLPTNTFEFPLKFSKWLQQVWLFLGLKQISIPTLQFVLLLGLTPIILIFHELSLYAQALSISVLSAFIFSAHWDKFLQFFHATNFNLTEPLFHRDISFYVFSLPIWELLESYLLGIFLYILVAAALIYLRSANSLSEGSFPGFSLAQRLHLNGLACLLMLSIALRYWLLHYSLLYEKRGVNYGASYTAVKILLPIYTALTWLAIAITVYLYVITGTKTKELDYPNGNDNAYTVYDGRGGIPIPSMWQRLLFAQYLKDWQMLLTHNFTPQTKLLFRRNIQQRVEGIAPFLHYDSDPYLVAAEGGGKTEKSENTYLYWIIDAYTTSDRYPYSDPGNQEFNYIRNSVKVVVDAYNGNVNFYIADPSDPIITSLDAIFPDLFKPLSQFSNTLIMDYLYFGSNSS